MNEGSTKTPERIAFIGFGEAGQALIKGWRRETIFAVCAYDIKTDDTAQKDAKLKDYLQYDVAPALSAVEAVSDADIIISAVTADAILDAAFSAVPALKPGQLYLDINSAAPSRKREASEKVGAMGAKYVDVAVMAPVHPKLHKVPLLIGGPGAEDVVPFFERLNMDFEVVSDEVGPASTVKMVRSVMIKGMESLTLECLLAAVASGIDGRILDSLEKSFPGMDWNERVSYMFERVARHGSRRAAEMREVARTMEDLGIGGTMALATSERQQRIADMELFREFPDGIPRDYRTLAKVILGHMEHG